MKNLIYTWSKRWQTIWGTAAVVLVFLVPSTRIFLVKTIAATNNNQNNLKPSPPPVTATLNSAGAPQSHNTVSPAQSPGATTSGTGGGHSGHHPGNHKPKQK